MTHDPNQPPLSGMPGGPQPFGAQPRNYNPQPLPFHGFGGTPPPRQPQGLDGSEKPKKDFGASFWIMSSLLGLIAIVDAGLGHGESILIFLGLAAFLTGLYSLIFKRRSWAALPGRTAAVCVTTAGICSLLLGGIAAGVDGSKKAALTAQPKTAIELESDVSADLAKREEEVRKSEQALKAREGAVTAAEGAASSTTIKEGIWTVGKDIIPGVYRTTAEVSGNCSWVVTRTGSNGKDYLSYDFYVKGGFPMVTLAEGQTFETEHCGNWAKQ